jgi:hypothetical protein
MSARSVSARFAETQMLVGGRAGAAMGLTTAIRQFRRVTFPIAIGSVFSATALLSVALLGLACSPLFAALLAPGLWDPAPD